MVSADLGNLSDLLNCKPPGLAGLVQLLSNSGHDGLLLPGFGVKWQQGNENETRSRSGALQPWPRTLEPVQIRKNYLAAGRRPNLQSEKFLLEELLVLMGGRAAEKTFYDSTTNGAAGDLDMARKLARKMIHEWGMGEKLYYEPDQRDAETEINRLLESADRQAHELILADRDKTKKLALALLRRETLSRDEVLDLFKPSEEPQRRAEQCVAVV